MKDPEWRRYDPAEDAAMELSASPKVVKGLRREKLDALDRVRGRAHDRNGVRRAVNDVTCRIVYGT